jgi:hypothetical protein
VVPTGQGLEADDAVVIEVDDRLVVHDDLGSGHGPPQVGFGLEPGDRGGMHLGLEVLVAVLAAFFGPAHGQIGVAQELTGGDGRPVEGDADAHRGRHLGGADHQRMAERVEDAPGEVGGDIDPLHVLDENGELVPAQPRRGVGSPEALHQAFAHRLEQLVTGAVPETVVDGLEVVQVQEQHREVPAGAPETRHGVPESVPEEGLVGQPGQRIVEAWYESSASRRLRSVMSLKLQTLPTTSPSTRWGLEWRSKTRPSLNSKMSSDSDSGCA